VTGIDRQAEKLELSADWRAHDPVSSTSALVLHPDDAVVNKVCALFGRALPRDFLDVDAMLMSGRYTREQLLELAAAADRGFDPLIFADALGALTLITDAAFAEYGTDPRAIADMRRRFAEWRRQLIEKRASS
jgi:enhancing lycopene biosynthesis protein 2